MMKPWTWACLLCNEVGNDRDVAPQLHKCSNVIDGLWGYWTYRFGRECPELSDEKIAKLLSRPIMRAAIAEMLGARWLPTGDIL